VHNSLLQVAIKQSRVSKSLTLRPNGVDLLPDPGHDGEVLGEVGSQDPGDPVGVQVLELAQF